MWDDYTKTTYTEHVINYTFNIFVEPCVVTSISVLPIPDIYYNIGDPALTEFYSLEQEPNCEYTMSYSLIGQQTFFTHTTADQKI